MKFTKLKRKIQILNVKKQNNQVNYSTAQLNYNTYKATTRLNTIQSSSSVLFKQTANLFSVRSFLMSGPFKMPPITFASDNFSSYCIQANATVLTLTNALINCAPVFPV